MYQLKVPFSESKLLQAGDNIGVLRALEAALCTWLIGTPCG